MGTFSKAKKALQMAKHFLCLRDENGKKYRKSVMLYGFYGMNLGDDLFFDKLLTRYPDTLFIVHQPAWYRRFFNKYQNVKFFASEERMVQKINRLGNKFHIRELFELLLLWRSNATVHIGGSIYQQVDFYLLDYSLRKRRKQPFKPFFSISCNFGAFHSDDFLKLWRTQFLRYRDVCFRDRFSYDLFSDVKSVRYAPDLLFSFQYPKLPQEDGSVCISVLDPFIPQRKIPTDCAEAYCKALARTVTDLVQNGKTVRLLGFCTFEGDDRAIQRILAETPPDIAARTEVLLYDFDHRDEMLDALASCEYVIGTRLHAVILGLCLGKKVLPLLYNDKIRYILSDLNYSQPTLDFSQFDAYAETGLRPVLQGIEPFDVSAVSDSDAKQFARLDKFLKKKP